MKEDKTELKQTELSDKLQNIKVKTYKDVELKNVEWIWFPYIPRGKFVFIMGDPGSGKTFFSTYLASVVSRGGMFYNSADPIEPHILLLQNGEDAKDDTIKARLEMMDANDENILYIDESDKLISLQDADVIEYILENYKPLLMIFDPATLYVGKKVDMNSANDIRNLLAPIGPLLEKYGCTMIIVLHMNKSQTKGIYKGLGTIDFMAIARSVITIEKNPDNKKERLLFHTKSSVYDDGETLAFTITGNGIEWLGVRDVNVDDLSNEEFTSKKEKAKEYILNYLSEDRSSEDLLKSGIENGFSQKTFENARKELRNENKITCFKGPDNKYYWSQTSVYPF